MSTTVRNVRPVPVRASLEHAHVPGDPGDPTDDAHSTSGGAAATDADIIVANYTRWRRFAAAVGPIDVEPDDLVQEALVRALERGPLHSRQQPAAYLCRTIANLASNRRRSLLRWRGAAARIQPTDVEVPSYPSDLTELDRLAPADRAVLYLVDVEGHSFREVADLLGGSERNHRLRASRARRRLARALDDDPEGTDRP